MEFKTTEEKIAALEALLFIHGEPVTRAKIARVLNLAEIEVDALVGELEKRLADTARGMFLVVSGEKVQLATKAQFGEVLQEFVKDQLTEDLTPSSVETLAIISYFGPISRARIEYLRGVNSIFTLRGLLLRGLIERLIDPERSSSYLYRPSFDLLKHVGTPRVDELPEYEKFQEVLRELEKPAEEKLPEETAAVPASPMAE